MKVAIASVSLLLIACTAPQPPAAPEPPAAPVPAAAPSSPTSPEQAGHAMGKRAPGDTAPAMAVFRAFGTEPFWNVNVEGATLTFTTPEDQDGVVMQGQRRAIDAGVELSGEHDGKPFMLTVTAGQCSDGMSDNQYELVARFRYGGTDFSGCGEAAK